MAVKGREWQPTTTTNGHRPPKLGDVEYYGHGDSWTVARAGREVCRGLSFDQLLSIIRGELDVDELVHRAARHD